MLIYRYTPEVVTFSGAWGGNTEVVRGLCRQVYIKSASVGTVFSARLTDWEGFEVRSWTDQTGEINDLTPFLVSGRYTLGVFDSTVDEAFSVLICVRDG